VISAWFSLCLRNRVGVLLVTALITVLAVLSASRAVIASSIGKLFLDDLPAYHDYLERSRDFGNDEVFVVAYEDDAPLSPAALDRLRAVVEQVAAEPDVARVTSLLDADHIDHRDDGTLVITPYAELAATDLPAATAALRADPLLARTLVAEDGRSALMLVELSVDPHRAVEEGPALVRRTIQTFADAGYPRETLHAVGLPALFAEIIDATTASITVLFPLSGLALGVGVLVLFRRLAPAMLALGIGLISVLWTLGFAALLDREFNIFTGLVPAIVLTVAFSDIVHLWSAWRQELEHGLSPADAVLASATDVGRACLLTSVTTFCGFASLVVVPTPVARQLGIVLGFGVGVSLLLAMTLVPIFLSWSTPPPPRKSGRDLIDRIVDLSAALSTRRAPWVLAGFLLACIPIATGVARFGIEADFSERFSSDNPYRVDKDWFERHYASTNTVDLYVHADQQEGIVDSEAFASIAELEQRLEALPEVDEVVSVVDLVRVVHEALDPAHPELPRTPGAIAQTLLVFDLAGGSAGSGGEALETRLDFPRQTTRLGLRLHDHGFRASGRAGEHAVEIAEQVLSPGLHAEANGVTWLLGSYFETILSGQRRGVMVSFGVIGLLMAAGLRSLRVGMLSMIPNLLPMFAIVAWSGFAYGQRVDSDTLIALIMAIGIGVDDTIHFLVRYRTEHARCGGDVTQALRKSFAFAGRAIVMTTVLLCVGFLPLALSDYFTLHMLGTLLPATLLVAVVADLLLVPAMLRTGLLRL